MDKVSEEIILIFDYKKEQSSQIIREAILMLERIIEQQENINNKSQQFIQIQHDINTVLAQAIE
ncbi:MAG: hypothetical protein QNJ70_20410 [Xenococcaceae cyanobacterium MO_207.B15]|nr:hypothetical protein [Xenococcaceae cyanobacterium MO_207.B15]